MAVKTPRAKRGPRALSRLDADALSEIRAILDRHTDSLAVQFKRIADLQADLDQIKRAWARMHVEEPASGTPSSEDRHDQVRAGNAFPRGR